MSSRLDTKLVTSTHSPFPRACHTMVTLKNFGVLVGGQTQETYSSTPTYDNNVWVYDFKTNNWNAIPPDINFAPHIVRYNHGSAAVSDQALVVYGGRRPDQKPCHQTILLFSLLDRKWSSLKVEGPHPGRRYGHAMANKPDYSAIIIHGGNNGTQVLNDLWILSLEKRPSWKPIEIAGEIPRAREFHSAGFCSSGSAKGMFIIFGGQGESQAIYNDIWGAAIRQSAAGQWKWQRAPIKSGSEPEARCHHNLVCWNEYVFVVGGRSAKLSPVNTAIYNTSLCQMVTKANVKAYKHAVVLNPLGESLLCIGGITGVQNMIGDFARDIPLSGLLAENSTTGLVSPPSLASHGDLDVAVKSQPRNVRINHTISADRDGKLMNLGIDTLQNEGEKIQSAINTHVQRSGAHLQVAAMVIEALLVPLTFDDLQSGAHLQTKEFPLSKQEVLSLLAAVLPILQEGETLVKCQAPCKIFGDIHGQYTDLMRFFGSFGCPVPYNLSQIFVGDLGSTDYVFLGDYVDRGKQSLEVICLLFALKIMYPQNIHLIRGNHEDESVNSHYGFDYECGSRLREDPLQPGSAFKTFNAVFEWLPLACVISDAILCVHGGIGYTINNLSDIRGVKRPIEVNEAVKSSRDQKVMDVLWSDPTSSDSVLGTQINDSRDPSGKAGISKFGPDRVQEFLRRNPPLDMIVRGHECVMDGIQRFANGKLFTVFSATDYCGTHNNAGGMLFVQKDLLVLPKIIYPVSRDLQNWNHDRPPTPPRSRPTTPISNMPTYSTNYVEPSTVVSGPPQYTRTISYPADLGNTGTMALPIISS